MAVGISVASTIFAQMLRSFRLGQAMDVSTALEAVKTGLKVLNADVQVTQEEYDEVIAIKAMFLNEDYL